MKTFIAIVATLLAGIALGAGSASVTWTQPTKDTAGAATTITSNTVYRGTKADGSDGAAIKTLSPAATAYTDAALAPGTYCYAVTASNANGESAKSPVACKTVAVPAAPTLVTVTTVAYTIAPLPTGGYGMVAIGTVPLGTACYKDISIATLYLVPKAQVTTSSQAAWFFGKCA